MKADLYGLLLLGGTFFSFQVSELMARDREAGALIELGGLKGRVPADWAEEVPYDPRCLKEYRLEPASDDLYYADVRIYSLGKVPEGTAARLVERWKQQFLPPEAKTMAEASRVHEFKVHGARVTYLDVRGDYKGVPGNVASRRENFRLLGVFLETLQGAYEITVFGPADTVELYRHEFEHWIKAFQ